MSLLSNLDHGIDAELSDSDSDNELESQHLICNNTIKNPFFNREKVIIENGYAKLIDINQKEFYYNFNKIYVICLKPNAILGEYIYKDVLTIKELKLFTQQFELIESNMKLLNNPVHKSQVVLIDSYYLKLFNSQYQYKEKELVIPLFNITSDSYHLYAKQFTAHFTTKDYLAIKLVNEFYTNKHPNINYITDVLKNSLTSNYWTKKFHTNINITSKFINRGFNLSLDQRINDEKLKQVLNDLNKMPHEGDTYLNYIYRKAVYVDVSSIIKKNGYSLYKINETIDLQKSDITYLLNNVSSKYEFYTLTMSLLISKDYCHYVLNNTEYMDKISNWKDSYDNSNKINLFNKYSVAFQYAIGYAWISLYMEECIKKSRITEDDRFVFTLDQANKLPYFPFVSSLTVNEQYRYNPYLTLFVSDNVLNLNHNTMGVEIKECSPSKKMGVVTIDKFKENFNTFLKSNKDIDILDGIDMTNFGISGSVIPACITKYNPLMDQFESKDRYYKEYYSSSDVDIMCNIVDDFEFIDRINKFHNDISINCQKYTSNPVELTSIKIAALIINETFIRQKIAKSDMTYEYVLTNLNDDVVKQLFYKCYTDYKMTENEKYIGSSKWTDPTYDTYFDIVPIDNIRIIFARTKNDWKKYWDNINKKTEETDELEESEKEYNYKTEEIIEENDTTLIDNMLFKCHENIKYRIKASNLNHELELFKIRWPTFFSTVCNFHLPCVRGYYDGNQVYLLPSCITAAMTLINVDYKYFAGSKDPIEIVNKYRQRGYSLPLNDTEKIRLASYSVKVDKWNKLYDKPDIKVKTYINRMFGYLPVKSTFFKPRRILSEEYNKIKPVPDSYNDVDEQVIVNEQNTYLDLLKIIYPQINNTDNIFKLCNLRVINNYGYINQIKKWYFDAIYENC